MALTGYIEVRIIYKEFPKWFGFYSFNIDNPFAGSWCAGVLASCFIAPWYKPAQVGKPT